MKIESTGLAMVEGKGFQPLVDFCSDADQVDVISFFELAKELPPPFISLLNQVFSEPGLWERFKNGSSSRAGHCSGQVISDSLIGFLDVDSRSKALGDRLPSFECSRMLL